MTNLEIIAQEAILNGVYTEEEVDNLIATYGDLGLHTYAEWKRLGYQVKKGSKSLFMARIWRPRKGKNKEAQEDENTIEIKKNFIKVNAYFFGSSQVEKLS